MTLTTILNDILVATVSKLVSNLAWFILIYWGIKTLAKNVPSWLDQYERIKIKQVAIANAIHGREKLK